VELTAPAGSVPAVHRVEGVSEAAATVFADTVNAALPERAEGSEVVDGSALVTVRALTESREERRTRTLKISGLAVLVLIVALAMAVGIHGVWSIAVLILLSGPLGAGITAFGAMAMLLVHYQWYLPRYGITVEAERLEDTSGLLGRSGNYAYTDMHGVSRPTYIKGSATTVQVAYHPRRPGTVVPCYSWLRKAWDTVFCLGILLIGLAIDAGVVVMAVGAFQGEYDNAMTPG
jgi:hypothetical protein